MTRTDKVLCATYAAFAAVALVGTQWALFAFLRSDRNDLAGLIDGVTANAAAGLVGIDLGMVALAAMVFMAVEGRRLRIPGWWAYVVGVLVVAVSVAFPLFLIARTRQLARQRVTARV